MYIRGNMIILQSKSFVGLVTFVCISLQSPLVSSGYSNKGHLRVYKGVDAAPGDYPYIMALVKRDSTLITKRICTCSLIHPEWVLIAAHCLRHVTQMGTLEPFTVVYGDLTIPASMTRQKRNVKKAINHFGFIANNIKSHIDEGLMQMDPAVLKDNIGLIMIDPLDDVEAGKISAVDYHALIGYPVKFLGSGGTYSFSDFFNSETGVRKETEKKDQTRPLQLGNAVVVKCAENNPFHAVLAGICVQAQCKRSHQSLIAADGGAPLLHKGKIVGVATMVTSGTEGERQRYGALKPIYRKDIGIVGTMYTALSPYLSWIYSVINRESCRSNVRARPAAVLRKGHLTKQIL